MGVLASTGLGRLERLRMVSVTQAGVEFCGAPGSVQAVAALPGVEHAQLAPLQQAMCLPGTAAIMSAVDLPSAGAEYTQSF